MASDGQVTFTISAYDRISGTLNSIRRTMRSMENTGTSAFRNIGRSIRMLTNPIRWVGSRLAWLGGILAGAVTAGAVVFGKSVIDAALEMDALRMGLLSVTGSAEETERQLSRLVEVAKTPGLGYVEAIKASVGLQAAGYSAREAEKAMIEFGNALALAGYGREEFERVMVNLKQMAGMARMSGAELRQTAQFVPQLYAALNRVFGTAETEKIAQMGITGKQAIMMIAEEFAKTLPRAGNSLKNQIGNIADAWMQFKAKLGMTLAPHIQNFANVLSAVIDKLSQSDIPEGFARAVSRIFSVENIRRAVAFVVTVGDLGSQAFVRVIQAGRDMWDVLKRVFTALIDLLGGRDGVWGVIEKIGKAMLAIMAARVGMEIIGAIASIMRTVAQTRNPYLIGGTMATVAGLGVWAGAKIQEWRKNAEAAFNAAGVGQAVDKLRQSILRIGDIQPRHTGLLQSLADTAIGALNTTVAQNALKAVANNTARTAVATETLVGQQDKLLREIYGGGPKARWLAQRYAFGGAVIPQVVR